MKIRKCFYIETSPDITERAFSLKIINYTSCSFKQREGNFISYVR